MLSGGYTANGKQIEKINVLHFFVKHVQNTTIEALTIEQLSTIFLRDNDYEIMKSNLEEMNISVNDINMLSLYNFNLNIDKIV